MTRSASRSATALAIVALAGVAASSIGRAGALGPSDRPGSSRAGVVGETKDNFYKDSKAFEIKDWNFGAENHSTIGSATGGAGAGKVKLNEFSIKKIPAVTSKNAVKCRAC